MPAPRTLPLYNPAATPAGWNECMVPGEFAVHFSYRRSPATTTPTCVVFASLSEAEAFAAEEISKHPDLRCRIYDHQGFVGAPLHEFAGPHFKSNLGLSSLYLRRLGGSLLLIGIILFLADWVNGFRFGWPGFIGARLLIFGTLLVMIELLFLLQTRYAKRPS